MTQFEILWPEHDKFEVLLLRGQNSFTGCHFFMCLVRNLQQMEKNFQNQSGCTALTD